MWIEPCIHLPLEVLGYFMKRCRSSLRWDIYSTAVGILAFQRHRSPLLWYFGSLGFWEDFKIFVQVLPLEAVLPWVISSKHTKPVHNLSDEPLAWSQMSWKQTTKKREQWLEKWNQLTQSIFFYSGIQNNTLTGTSHFVPRENDVLAITHLYLSFVLLQFFKKGKLW